MTTRLVPIFAFSVLVAAAFADDGVMYFNGSPKLMHGEGQIRMVKEYVHITIHEVYAEVYCRFVFQNQGPATLARIGFPDGSDEGEREGEMLKAEMFFFRSTVDGSPINTTVEPAKLADQDIGAVFHVKRVPFAKGQTRVVEDWYKTPLGSLASGATHYSTEFTYIMESGASWHGPISEAKVEVDFAEPPFRRVRPIPSREGGSEEQVARYATTARNTVLWTGFAIPTATGNRLTFVRKNFKPTKRSNVALSFQWLTEAQSEEMFNKEERMRRH